LSALQSFYVNKLSLLLGSFGNMAFRFSNVLCFGMT